MYRKIGIIALFSFVFVKALYSQRIDSTYSGVVSGAIKDTAHDYFLSSATVSVYTEVDSALQNYLLSNNFGEFTIGRLPVNTRLRLVVSYAGYRSLLRNFIIGPSGMLDMGTLNMTQKTEGELEEVVIRVVPPVRMNGDTLEFNADAFKLDTNAVVEDLFRRLPGLIIWGDGAITFNGRKITNVLVEGKPFFGTDAKIATQNLPKNSVDKVQVYSKVKDLNNPLDSLTEINIKLKKDKQYGSFGKLSGGIGTSAKYDTDGAYNVFSPKTQFGFAISANNVNKQASDMDMLLRNASFKGIGTAIDYQPNFRISGLSEPITGGISVQHDFISNPSFQRNNRLTSDYFYSYLPLMSDQSTTTITSLADNSILSQNSKAETFNKDVSHKIRSDYELKTPLKVFTLTQQFGISTSKNANLQSSTLYNGQGDLQNTMSLIDNDDRQEKLLQIGIGFSKSGAATNRKTHIPRAYDVRYNLEAGDQNVDRIQQSSFVSQVDQETNLGFVRRYINKEQHINQNLNFRVNDFNRLLFGAGDLMGIKIGLQNNLSVYRRNDNNHITDFDSLKNAYNVNSYLTNNSTYTTIDEQPAVSLKRLFTKGLINRYQKNISVDFLAKMQFYNQVNTSQRTFQMLNRWYKFFLPSANFVYTNRQFGDYNTTYKFGYNTSTEYPTINQIAPLIDSTNITDLFLGNSHISASYKREVSMSLTHSSERSRTPFSYDIKVLIGRIDNRLSDSSQFDGQGRRRRFLVNADGSRYGAFVGSINKAVKVRQKLVTAVFNTRFDLERIPGYIDSKFFFSDVKRSNHSLKLDLTINDLLSLNAGQEMHFFSSKVGRTDGFDFKNSMYSTSLSVSVNCTKKLNVSSSMIYNKNVSRSINSVAFTIWNANVSHRFMKGNNLELKLSALDLLRQNKGLINYGSANSLTSGSVAVLKQYFMLTLAYFPRRF